MKISIVEFYRNIRKYKKIEQKFGKKIFLRQKIMKIT